MQFLTKVASHLKYHNAFFIIASILLTTGGISIFSSDYVSKKNDQVFLENIQPTEAIRHINDLMNQYRLKTYQQIASIELDESMQVELPLIEEEIDYALSEKGTLYLTRFQTVKFKRLKNYWKHLKKSYKEILELSENYAKEEALEEISGNNQILANNASLALSELISMKLREVEIVNAENNIVRLWSKIITYIALLLGVIVSFSYITRYKRIIQNNISTLKNKVDERTAELNATCETLEDKKQLLEKLIILDPLTGIYNRRQCDAVFKSEWQRSCRKGKTITVIMVDVDYFKDYNDNYGHIAGDNALRKIAITLRDCLKRPADFICRYGGEEFLAILPDSNLSGIEHAGEIFREAIEDIKLPHEFSGVSNHVTISIGMVTATLPSEKCHSAETLMKLADEMLYKAKENGRNQVQSCVI